MPSFFELQKYAATGIASADMTAFDKARALAAFGGGAVQTLTDVPPLSFKANGKPLISWSMLGNGAQSGTPTPDNPIQPTFCGVRTAQLFDYQTMAHGTDGAYLNENGSVINNNTWNITDFIPCSWNAYTLHKVGGESPAICLYDAEKQFIIGKKYSTGGATRKTDITITSQTDAAFIRFSWNNGSDIEQDDLTKIMLNTGTIALHYEPFGWKIPITCAGQTVPVYLGQVSTVRKIRKFVLTGEESMTLYTVSTGNLFRIDLPTLRIQGQFANAGMCTHYRKVVAEADRVNGTISGGNAATVQGVVDIVDDYATVADFKTYLADQYAAGTPVTVWYVLATPETAIINEPLCKIGDYADELHSEDTTVSIPTAKGQNTLTVEGDLQPSEMTITYFEEV